MQYNEYFFQGTLQAQAALLLALPADFEFRWFWQNADEFRLQIANQRPARLARFLSDYARKSGCEFCLVDEKGSPLEEISRLPVDQLVEQLYVIQEMYVRSANSKECSDGVLPPKCNQALLFSLRRILECGSGMGGAVTEPEPAGTSS